MVSLLTDPFSAPEAKVLMQLMLHERNHVLQEQNEMFMREGEEKRTNHRNKEILTHG